MIPVYQKQRRRHLSILFSIQNIKGMKPTISIIMEATMTMWNQPGWFLIFTEEINSTLTD
jgi:hypothetical protein